MLFSISRKTLSMDWADFAGLISKKVFIIIFKNCFILDNVQSEFSAQKKRLPPAKTKFQTSNRTWLVHTKILYDEIYDIDISEGHYRASVEVTILGKSKTEDFFTGLGLATK